MKRQHTAEIVDIEKHLLEQERAERLLPRNGTDMWKVRAEPIDFTRPDGHTAWSTIKDGELVRIPLIPYRSATEPVEAMLGAMDIIQRYVEAVPNAVRTHIILGKPIEDLSSEGENVFRFWVGFAAKIH